MIALAIAGVVISGAFAVGAPTLTLGQLSANGAGESLLKRAVATGRMVRSPRHGRRPRAGGSARAHATGIDNWIIVTSVRSRGRRDLTAIAITGVLAATIAVLPARSAAKVPVLSALAGRRPLGAPRAIVPIGIAVR